MFSNLKLKVWLGFDCELQVLFMEFKMHVENNTFPIYIAWEMLLDAYQEGRTSGLLYEGVPQRSVLGPDSFFQPVQK